MTKKFQDYHGFYDQVVEYMEQLCHGRYITEKKLGFHDSMVEYVENICSDNGCLGLCSKHQLLYHILLPLIPFFIKHEEKVCLWDHFLDWIHYESEVT